MAPRTAPLAVALLASLPLVSVIAASIAARDGNAAIVVLLLSLLADIEIGRRMVRTGTLSERSVAIALAVALAAIVVAFALYSAWGFGQFFGRDYN